MLAQWNSAQRTLGEGFHRANLFNWGLPRRGVALSLSNGRSRLLPPLFIIPGGFLLSSLPRRPVAPEFANEGGSAELVGAAKADL